MGIILAHEFMSFRRAESAKSTSLSEYHRNKGNRLLKAREFHEALLEYNFAISFAWSKSQNLAIAYLNRSAVYLECQKFDESLENIKWARESNFPEYAIEQLDEWEEKCRSRMETKAISGKGKFKVTNTDKKFDPWSFFKLSRPANEKIPFIINE